MFSEIANSEKYTTSFMYDRDNRILEVVYEQLGYKISYTYDALGRLTSECVKNENDIMLSNVTYNYMPGGYGENSTTSMIFSINMVRLKPQGRKLKWLKRDVVDRACLHMM